MTASASEAAQIATFTGISFGLWLYPSVLLRLIYAVQYMFER